MVNTSSLYTWLSNERDGLRNGAEGLVFTLSKNPADILAINTPMPNLMFPNPDRKRARPKGTARTRHPFDQQLYRRKHIRISRLVGVLAPHDHAERIATQGPTPSGSWYRADVAVIYGRLDGAKAGVEVGGDPGVGGVVFDEDVEVGLRFAVGCILKGIAGLENASRSFARFKLIARLYAGWGGCSGGR